MPDADKTTVDQPTAPVNGEPMTPRATRTLGIYFLALGLTLFYLAFIIWPPDFQSLFTPGTREEDKERNPLSPIIFFDCSACQPKTTLTPARVPRTVTPLVSNGTLPVIPALSTPDAVSPAASGATPPLQTSAETRRFSGWRICVTYDQRLFLLVLILGALGSYIHAVMSFADFAGNRRLVQSWLWWYLLRPFTGAPIALILYFAVRAGFMTPTATGGDVSRFGIAALAMLAGMFSVKAADKLEEVFDVLFKTQEKRKDSLENPLPVLDSITPTKVTAGSGAQKVVMKGSNFSMKAVVLVDNAERSASVDSATKLTVELSAEDVKTARIIKLAVKNPPPGGGTSTAISLPVE